MTDTTDVLVACGSFNDLLHVGAGQAAQQQSQIKQVTLVWMNRVHASKANR
jgi:hypothetical protein